MYEEDTRRIRPNRSPKHHAQHPQEIHHLIDALRQAPQFNFPFSAREIDEEARARSGQSKKFIGSQRRAIAAFAHARCEVPTCRATADDAVLTVHHIRFKRHGGRNTLYNAEYLCVDCHQGAHGGRENASHERDTDAIAVSGIPVRTMFRILQLFVDAGLLTATPVFGEPDPLALEQPRRTVQKIRLYGSGIETFRHCQRLLRYATLEAHVTGRLSHAAENVLVDFVRTYYLNERNAA